MIMSNNGIRTLSVPMYLDLLTGPFAPYSDVKPTESSSLLKFLMTPKLRLVTSSRPKM